MTPADTAEDVLLVDRDMRGVVTLTLNRPERRNALNPALMEALGERITTLADDEQVRVVVLAGAGGTFCAGADLEWMAAAADRTREDNLTDARRLEELLRTLDTLPRPVVVVAEGHALGGAVGLIACADVVLADEDARLGFPEVRLGLAPAVISGYVQPRIGVSAARRYFLTGEIFDARTARRMGLVHEVVPADELAARRDRIVDRLLAGGPEAQAAIKGMVAELGRAPDRQARADITVPVIAARRVSAEGREGMAAFFEDRAPSWAPESGSGSG